MTEPGSDRDDFEHRKAQAALQQLRERDERIAQLEQILKEVERERDRWSARNRYLEERLAEIRKIVR